MSDKQFYGLYFSRGTMDAVRETSRVVGTSLSALIDFCVRRGLEQISEDELRREFAAIRNAPSALPVLEKRVYEALRAFVSRTPETWSCMLGDLLVSTGLPRRSLYCALKSLQVRGLIEGDESEDLDRWGRPKESIWRLPPPERDCIAANWARLGRPEP